MIKQVLSNKPIFTSTPAVVNEIAVKFNHLDQMIRQASDARTPLKKMVFHSHVKPAIKVKLLREQKIFDELSGTAI